MEFADLVKARRSYRSYDTSPVSEAALNAILDAGRWAPNPLNLQPWEFIVITDPQTKARIRAVAEEAKQKVMDGDGPGWVTKYGLDFIEEAPLLVVVLSDPAKSGLGSFFGQKYGAIQASSACVQNMILAAADMGLGSLWFTWFEPEKLQALLNIPNNLEIAAVLPIGKPREPVKAPPRKDPKIHREGYGKGD